MNIDIGYSNHKYFIVFLYSTLITCALFLALNIRIFLRFRDTYSWDSCFVIRAFFYNGHFHLICLQAILSVAIIIGVLLLAWEQTDNIFRNLTINETIHLKKTIGSGSIEAQGYKHLFDEQGNFFNHFDRGWFSNFCEFFGLLGKGVDYTNIYELPGISFSKYQGRPISSADIDILGSEGSHSNSKSVGI